MKKNKGEVVTGKISVNSRGFGFVTAGDGDILIKKLKKSLHGDTVKVRIKSEEYGRKIGEIEEIVEHAKKYFVGKLKIRRKNFYVEPDDERYNFLEIKIKNVDGLKEIKKSRAKVAVEITDWENFTGKIVEIIDKKNNRAGITSILRNEGVFEKFPDEVLRESKKIEREVSEDEIKNRTDRRDLKIVTIDGEDAKDLDDGVYAKKNGDEYFLGVYIADVSHYVKKNSAIDIEALERGTSIYPTDRVVPMLPIELSNGICSLNEGKNRLAMACEMKINKFGKVAEYKIFPTVIKIFKRLNYDEVNKFYAGETEIENCGENLKILREIYELRKKILNERGAIDFEIPEIKIILDADEKPIKIYKKNRGIAERVIEQMMLMANETVAEHTQKKNIPSLYRVHENPEEEKIRTLNRILGNFGLRVPTEKINPRDIQKILEKVKNNPAEKIISNFTLRAMQQARYATENLGHFGIAAEFYTHFTSPIRRYPDLIVHRMLHASAENPEKISKLEKSLSEAAKKSSDRERRAVEIERSAVAQKSCEYMKKFLWEKFDAIICSVTKFGFFAELDNGIDGLVHISTLRDDYYEFDENKMELIGFGRGKIFKIGDKVTVQLVEANVESGKINFELAEEIIAEDF